MFVIHHLLLQVVRPDRLATAMSAFVCNAIGLTNMAAPPLDIAKMLAEEATAGELQLHLVACPSPTTTKSSRRHQNPLLTS